MLLAVSSVAKLFVSTILCSLTIKLLDDYLDREIDAIDNSINLINQFGEATIVYALPLFGFSLLLAPPIALALFSSAWIVGMFRTMKTLFPSGLRGWQESLLIGGFGVWLTGWSIMIFSLVLTFSVQLIDDLLDQQTDKLVGIYNLALQWGNIVCFITCSICLVIAYLLEPELFKPIGCGIIISYLLVNLIDKPPG